MIAPTTRALLADAWHQVLDNRMFRLLVLVTIVLVAPTFLIAFEREGIDILFGFRMISYQSLLESFGTPGVGGLDRDLSVQVIQGLQAAFVDTLSGTVGVLFCIAATAFFLPQALEKGTADIVFAQPVSRPRLLVARYLAGLLFVGALASLLVVGMHTGLLVTSGYSDPGFLWSILTLVYLFALLHAFSICVGVLTRSSVTALLSTMMLFVFTGCVQGIWTQKERALAQAAVGERRGAPPAGVEPSEGSDGTEAREERSTTERVLLAALDTAHWILPKTNDAGVLARKLRRSLERAPAFVDPDTGLVVPAAPAGFERQAEVDPPAGGASWARTSPQGVRERIGLRRFPRREERGEGKRPRFLYAGTLAQEHADELVAEGRELHGGPRLDQRQLGGDTSTSSVVWTELAPPQDDDPGGLRRRETHFFPGTQEWMYRVDSSFAADSGLEAEESLGAFLARIQPPGSVSTDWYEERMSFGGPLRYNLFFSLATSAAFALAMLGLAAWRLGRIDF